MPNFEDYMMGAAAILLASGITCLTAYGVSLHRATQIFAAPMEISAITKNKESLLVKELTTPKINETLTLQEITLAPTNDSEFANSIATGYFNKFR